MATLQIWGDTYIPNSGARLLVTVYEHG